MDNDKLERTTILDSDVTTDTNYPENDEDVTRYADNQVRHKSLDMYIV